MASADKKEIVKKSQDISRWYTDVILKAKLADYGPAKGTMVIRPYGYAIWEQVQEIFNGMIKPYGVENAYFPLFIPHSLLEKEKQHVEGFSPELAVVTHGGGKELAEPLVVRPTSETIMYEMYSKWIQSWRDLPMRINQWNNVVRWELRTYLFLRTTEFLWQEGHTAHASDEEAREMQRQALEWYRQIYEDYYAVPVVVGEKSAAERFAGAVSTYAVEALMPDGKALQGATSHHLGQNFSRAFNIDFQTKEGKVEFVWQTSWGLSTRSMGGLFLVHGDDDGLVLPPRVAPQKVAIIPILGKNDTKVLEFCERIKQSILAVDSLYPGKVDIWDEEEKSFGWKANEAEVKGIPLTVVVGEREVDAREVTIKFRERSMVAKKLGIDGLGASVEAMLGDMQANMLEKQRKFLGENTRVAGNYEEFKQIMSSTRGFIKAFWCGQRECEARIKEETKATTRVLPFDREGESGACVYCGREANELWYFAQAY